MQDAQRRIQVAGLLGPLLTFALVGRQFQYAPIRQMKSLIAIEYGLHQIVARGQRRQAPRRPAEGVVIEDRGLSRRESLNVQAKNIGTRKRLVRLDMSARLARQVATEQQDDPAVERPAVCT